MSIETRQYYGGGSVCYSYGRPYRCNSAWNRYGRWVLLGCLIFGFFILFYLFSCISARRRRKAGRQPFMGTGWAGRLPGHGQAAYNPNYSQTQQPQQNYQPPPPQYNQNQGGYYGGGAGGGANADYYGGQRNDVEMTAPGNTYGGGEYQAPAGPPPGKR